VFQPNRRRRRIQKPKGDKGGGGGTDPLKIFISLTNSGNRKTVRWGGKIENEKCAKSESLLNMVISQ